MDQTTINTYNRSADQMAEKFNRIGPRVDDIERGFSFIKNGDPFVLEIGCGNGRDAEEIKKRSKNYIGIDASSGMIELAKQHVPDGHFEVANILSYDVPNGIDLIFAFASFLHLNKNELASVLSRAHEALSDDGVIYISVKEDDYQENIKIDEFGERTFYFYRKEDIETAAGDQFETIYEDHQTILGVNWLTVVLRKV